MRITTLIMLALALPHSASALPPNGNQLTWYTIDSEGFIRSLDPAPKGKEWQQACFCRQPYAEPDATVYRQCLCTEPSLEPPNPTAPMSWIVQRASGFFVQ